MSGGYLESLAEWEDDDLMDFMYGSFPSSRSVKPGSWDEKLSFWQSAIAGVISSGSSLTLTPSTLEPSLLRDGVAPSGLPTVVTCAISSGTWIPVSQLPPLPQEGRGLPPSTPPKGNTLSWLVDAFVSSPLKWATGSGSADSDPRAIDHSDPVMGSTDVYVVVSLAVEMVDRLLHAHFDAGKLGPVTDLEHAAAVLNTTPENLQLGVRAVKDAPGVVLFADPGGHLGLKFGPRKDVGPDPVDETDFGVFALQRMARRLRAQHDELVVQVSVLGSEVKAALAAGSRERAKILLRRKKALDAVATSRLQAWDKVQTILDGIDSAATSAELVEVYKAGRNALVALTPDPDAVEETMEDLEDALASQAEIDGIMAGASSRIDAASYPDLDLEDDVLAAELDALVLEDEQQEGDADGVGVEFPDVPTHSPSVQDEVVVEQDEDGGRVAVAM